MAAPLESTFHKAIQYVFNSWTALQLAVQSGFGGASSTAKASWMVDITEQWLKECGDVEPYELEDYLGEIINNEFDTIVDDGSLEQVSRSICSYLRMCEENRDAEVLAMVTQLVPASVGQCVHQRQDSEASSSDEESEHDMEVGECVGATGGATCSTVTASTSRGATGGTCTYQDQSPGACGDAQSSNVRHTEDDEMREETKMDSIPEEDGWTVVKKHTKPRR